MEAIKDNKLFRKTMNRILLISLGGNFMGRKELEASLKEIEYSIEHLILEARESNDR